MRDRTSVLVLFGLGALGVTVTVRGGWTRPWQPAVRPVDDLVAGNADLPLSLVEAVVWGLSLYALLVGAALAVARVSRHPAPLRFVPRVVRPAGGAVVVGASLALASPVAAQGGDVPDDRPALDVAVMERLGPVGSPTTTVTSAAPGPAADHDAVDVDGPSGPDAPDPAAEQPASAPAGTDPTWTVRSGDHLWGIAEETLADAGRTDPPEAAIRDYWQALIDANRDRLVDPGNPDLILPTQVLRLPRVEDARGGS